jgi:hypothetical protein
MRRIARSLGPIAGGCLLLVCSSTIVASAVAWAGIRSNAPLNSRVVTKVGTGYTESSTAPNAPHMHTGRLGLVAATYGNCQGVLPPTLRQDHWVASVERIWIDRVETVPSLLNLCVTEFSSTKDAQLNVQQNYAADTPIDTAPSDLGSFSIPGASDGQGRTLLLGDGFKDYWIVISKSKYVVTAFLEYLPPKQPTKFSIALDTAAIAMLTHVGQAQSDKLP